MVQKLKDMNFKFDVAIPAMFVVLFVTVALLGFPEQSQGVVNSLFAFMTGELKSVYVIFGTFGVFFLIWISFSKYGNIRFGGPDTKPEFTTMQWAAMIFTAGMGIGICYWAFVEPVIYFATPPLGMEPFSDIAGEWGMTYAFFHWGFTPWGLYGIPTIAVAYGIHNRKIDGLSMSTAASGVLGKWSYKWPGKLIDILVVIALFGGLGTSLALGVPLVSTMIATVIGIEVTLGLQIVVVVAWTALFTLTVWAGLEKGMAKLSDFNTYLALGLLAFIFLVGPMSYLVDLSINALGLLLANFLRISLWTDPIGQTGFVEGWTVFYWAWWAAVIPAMALFTARISKGRTIKSMSLTTLVVGSAGCFAFFGVWGGYSTYLQTNNILDVYSIYAEAGAPAAAVAVLQTLPLGIVVVALFAILAMIFLSTTINTGAYTIASTVTKHLKGDEQPGRFNRTLWGVLYGVYAAALFITAADSGSISSIQLSAILTAFPIIFVALIVMLSGMKWIKEDYDGVLAKKDMTLPYEALKEMPVYDEMEQRK